jgi:hypothetical protein
MGRTAQRGDLPLIKDPFAKPNMPGITLAGGNKVPKSKLLLLLLLAIGLAGGCEDMTPAQRGAVTGGALGTGIGMVAGGSFGQVVGAGLIGGAAGAIVGSAVGNR